jgi:hypothetical protein
VSAALILASLADDPDLGADRAYFDCWRRPTVAGRLAITTTMQKTGMGEFLLMDALARSLQGTKTVMSFAVLVDAMNKQAEAFYRKYGFIVLRDNRLFLPIKTVERLPLPGNRPHGK